MKENGKVNIGLVLGIVVVIVVVAAAALVMTQPSTTPTTTTVTTTTTQSSTTTSTEPVPLIVQLDWLPGGANAMFFIAQDMFWPNRGLDVTLIRGSGSEDTARKVGLRAVDFGFASFANGVGIKAKELLPIICLYSANLKNDVGAFYIKGRDAGRGIIDATNAETLAATITGKIMGEPVYSASVAQMGALCAQLGLPTDAVTIMNMDPSATIPSLIRGDTDFSGVGRGEDIPYAEAVAQAGLEGAAVWYGDFGVDEIGDALWTSLEMVYNRPEVVRQFVAGLQEAQSYMLANPEAAFEVFVAANPSWIGQEDAAMEEFIARYHFTEDPEVDAAHGVGYIPEEIGTPAVINAYSITGVEPDFYLDDPTDAWTNEFIDPTIVPTEYPW